MKKIIVIISLITSFVSVYSAGYDGYTGCAEQDSLALVAFYWATDGPNWTSNQDGFSISDLSDDVLIYHTTDYPYAGLGKWLEGPVKDWFGVLLEKQQVGNTTDSVWRVIHLRATISRRSAGNNNLSGYVPKEVGMLTALQWFKVNGNVGLTGSIPDEIYHPTLRQIDVEATYFNGIVSSAIRQCAQLKFINLRYNYFDSVPLFDFVNHDSLGSNSIFFYQNQISWAALEPSVDYFLANSITYEARDQKSVGRAREIVVTPGSNVTLTSNDAGSQGTYTWYKKGLNTYITGPEYTISSVSASDTGNYTVLVANEYIRLNDKNADYVNTFTKPIHVTFIPSIPACQNIKTSYNGQEVYLTFSKPMAKPGPAQASEFTVTADGKNINVTGISRKGRLNDQLVLKLKTPVIMGETVLVSYSKGDVVDINGGSLNSFTDKPTENLVRTTPTLVDAITRVDGEGIILTFDSYIDGTTLNKTGFTIGGSAGNSVAQVILRKGPLDDYISKEIELILNEPLFDTDTALTVSYTMGAISALYGATVPSFGPESVTNVVEVNRTEVNISVIDGTENLKNIIIKGEMKSLPFNLYDDGTHGDINANDHVWSTSLQISNGTYQWEVYEREVQIEYDTVIIEYSDGQITMILTPINPDDDPIEYDTAVIENSDGQVTLMLTPVEMYKDSLLSCELALSVTINNGIITGDTLFEYYNETLTFILNMKNYMDNNPLKSIEPYLMGIREDWTKGIKMEILDSSDTKLTYKTIVSGFKSGEEVNFNFRNDNEWENDSPLTRTHTVQENDTIISTFGLAQTGISRINSSSLLLVYPNPVEEFLFVRLSDDGAINNIKIFNLFGQQLFNFNNIGEKLTLPASKIGIGIYIIEVTTENGDTLRGRFIKN